MAFACCYLPPSAFAGLARAARHGSSPPGPSAATVQGWLTAWGTVILAIFAIVTAIYAIRAYRKQVKEVSDMAEILKVQSDRLDEERKINDEHVKTLKLQAQELEESLAERKREAEQRRRAQASRVFIWQEYREGNPALSEGPPPDYLAHLKPLPHGESLPLIVAHVENTSEQPVYDLVVTWTYDADFRGESKRMKPLMPHKEQVEYMEVPAGGDLSLLTAIAYFRDAAGVRWRSRPDGQFDEIPTGQPDQEQENTPGG